MLGFGHTCACGMAGSFVETADLKKIKPGNSCILVDGEQQGAGVGLTASVELANGYQHPANCLILLCAHRLAVRPVMDAAP